MKAQDRFTTMAPTPAREKRQGRGRNGNVELVPSHPERRQPRHQQDARQAHSDARTVPGRFPTQGGEDQEVDRGVLQEIDAVGEKRDRADGEGHGELDAEVAEVQERPTMRTILRRPGSVCEGFIVPRLSRAEIPHFPFRFGPGDEA